MQTDTSDLAPWSSFRQAPWVICLPWSCVHDSVPLVELCYLSDQAITAASLYLRAVLLDRPDLLCSCHASLATQVCRRSKVACSLWHVCWPSWCGRGCLRLLRVSTHRKWSEPSLAISDWKCLFLRVRCNCEFLLSIWFGCDPSIVFAGLQGHPSFLFWLFNCCAVRVALVSWIWAWSRLCLAVCSRWGRVLANAYKHGCPTTCLLDPQGAPAKLVLLFQSWDGFEVPCNSLFPPSATSIASLSMWLYISLSLHLWCIWPRLPGGNLVHMRPLRRRLPPLLAALAAAKDSLLSLLLLAFTDSDPRVGGCSHCWR